MASWNLKWLRCMWTASSVFHFQSGLQTESTHLLPLCSEWSLRQSKTHVTLAKVKVYYLLLLLYQSVVSYCVCRGSELNICGRRRTSKRQKKSLDANSTKNVQNSQILYVCCRGWSSSFDIYNNSTYLWSCSNRWTEERWLSMDAAREKEQACDWWLIQLMTIITR